MEPGQKTSVSSGLNAIAETALEQYQLPGLAIAIAKYEREVFASGYGHCDAAASQAVTADTLFGVASVTKFLTAISILHLRDNGLLSLDTPVNHYFPALQAAADNAIQVKHLLRHAAGWRGLDSRFHALDRASTDLPDRPALETVDDLVNHMNRAGNIALTRPDERLNYSNEGFCLLGGIVEQITGQPWHQYAEQQFLQKARLCCSTFGIPDPSRYHSVANPLLRNNGHWQTAGFWDAPLFYPAGGMVTSCRDLLRLLKFIDDNNPVLTTNSKKWLQTPAIAIASRDPAAFGYSAGLEYRKFDSGLPALWHTGQRAGISSFIATTPENGYRIAVLSNVADAPLTSLAFELLSHLDPGSYNPHWPPVAGTSLPMTDDDVITGRYDSEEGFSFAVQRDGSKYFLINAKSNTRSELVFQTATSGYTGQSTFAFLPATDKGPVSLALDLRLFSRSEQNTKA